MSDIAGRLVMTSKIFKSILSVAMVVLLASLTVITGVLYQYFGNLQGSQLKDELSLAANATEKLGQEYLEDTDSDRYRLTWISRDGTVLFDSHADASTMENHAEREEVKEALEFGTGSSTRHSYTLTEKTIYEAVRLDDGSILRISVSRLTAWILVVGMFHPIAWIIIASIALSIWLAKRMARKVVQPLSELDLENPMENDVYEEISPLLRRLYTQHQEIQYQMRTLNRKQEEFELITSNMKEALVLLDQTGRIVSINPAAKALYGVNTRCIGEVFLTIDRQHDMRLAVEEAMEKGQSYFHSSKNGCEYQYDLSRIDSEGKRYGVVVLAFDITEQMAAEQHRREFTANVSHELKTPLQSIIGSAELMENGLVKEEDVPRFLGHIRGEASRLVILIEDIIRLSQLDEGTDMPTEEVALLELSEEVCESLIDVAKAKDVSVVVSGTEGMMQGVRRLLYEVVYNLCDNAIKYNRVGGTVSVEVKEQDGSVRLSVSDNGIGIAPEYHEKIFERFYRVDKSHSKQSGGTGLGLSIVKHAVQYHHGRILVDSEPNKGTTISLLFNRNAFIV